MEPKFNIFSGALKALDSAQFSDGKRRLTTTASSDIVDLAGDRMTERALQRMAATAERGMTIFLNHSYRVPEDVLGTVEKASLEMRGDSVDLDFVIRVEEANPRAVKAHEMVMSGTQLGCSIGAMIPEGGAKRSDTGLVIDDVQLLEASIVGIPANPRAFAHYAAKSFFEAEQSEDEDELETGGTTVVINGLPVDEVLTSRKSAEPEPTPEKTPEELAPERNENEPNDGPVATSPSTLEERTDAPPEGDQGDDAAEKAADVPATQEAPESDPENEGDEDDTDEIASKSIGVLREILRSAQSDLVETRKALAGETEKRVAAESRAEEAEENLAIARDIVESLAALPMGRKTHFRGKVSEFRTKLSGIYGPDVLNLVEKQDA